MRSGDQVDGRDCSPAFQREYLNELLRSSAEPATTARLARRWQFRLRHVFSLTTFAAIAAALVRIRGLGTLVVSAGLVLVWLNWLGAFDRFHQGRPRMIVLSLAWLTFLISLALPSIEVFGPINGGMAAWLAITLPWYAIMEGKPPLHAMFVYMGIDVANVLMLLLPLLMWRLSRGRGQALSAALCIAMVAPWCVSGGDVGGVLIGYYVWTASFGMAALGLRISTRLLVLMAVEAATILLVVR